MAAWQTYLKLEVAGRSAHSCGFGMTYGAFTISPRYGVRDLKELIEKGFCHNEAFAVAVGDLWWDFFLGLIGDREYGSADDVDDLRSGESN